jgi:peptide/nickel transport system substrate-binding protein
VKVILDPNTLAANLLAGIVDITSSLGSIDLGVQLRDQWRGGTVIFNLGGDTWGNLVPQFIDPRPAAVTDLQVRRALIHAINRQEIVDTLMAGMSPVPHTFMSPNQAAYRDIEAAVPRYEYDPRQAAQILESRDYRKGADGVYRDAGGQRLELEVREGAADEEFWKAALAVADSWNRFGAEATPLRPSPQQIQDQQYIATFPAFAVFGGSNDLSGLRNLHSTQTRLPSNNFRVVSAGNRSRYMNPELDALLETHFKTVPIPERIQALGKILRHLGEQATPVGLFYNPRPAAHSARLMHVSSEWPAQWIAWNAHEWDVRG